MRAVIYVRVSTGQQALQDLSMPDQIAQCKAYCSKKDWEVASTFADAGASATNDNRVEFQAMIAEACSIAKPFDVVIVHSQSRFARNTLDLLYYTKKLEKADVQFVSITQDIGTGDQANVLRTILGAMDEYQSKEISKHVSRSMCENARQGFWNGSQPPLGYRAYTAERRGKKDKKKLEIDPAEAETVKRIFNLYIHGEGTSGALGLKAIANLLNFEGIQTRRGKKFLIQYVHKILTNEVYVAKHYFNLRDSKTKKLKPKECWIALKTPRIISDIVFNAVRDRLKHNHPLRTAPRIVNSNILLTGLLHCSRCNSRMRIQTGKSGAYKYYRCAKHSDAGNAVCTGCSMRMEKLDDLVMNRVLDRIWHLIG
jgi:DNA invertase Pin-like site-specific DNA recombinase